MKYAISTAAAIATITAFAMLSPAVAGDLTGAHKMSGCGNFQLHATGEWSGNGVASGGQSDRDTTTQTDTEVAGNGDGGNTSGGQYQIAGNGDGGVTSPGEILKAENAQVAE